MSAAHLSSNPTRVYASNTTFAFLKQDKAGSSQWQAVDDNDKCTKEEVLAVSGEPNENNDICITFIQLLGFNALTTGTKTDGSSVPICGTAITTNLTAKRSHKMETGRCVFIFKNNLGTSTSKDMRTQLEELKQHNAALKTTRQPLQAVSAMALLWFEENKLEEWLVHSLQFVYDNTGWPLRQALPVAQCIMWINYLEDLSRQSQIGAATQTTDFPGSRYRFSSFNFLI